MYAGLLNVAGKRTEGDVQFGN